MEIISPSKRAEDETLILNIRNGHRLLIFFQDEEHSIKKRSVSFESIRKTAIRRAKKIGMVVKAELLKRCQKF